MRHSMYNTVRAQPTLKVALRGAGTVHGDGVDLNQNLDACESAMAVIHTGTMTDGSVAITLEHSDDNSTYTTVSGAELQGTAPTIAASDDDKVYELGYLGHKRYLRVSAVTTGGSTGGTFGATIIRGFVQDPPISRA